MLNVKPRVGKFGNSEIDWWLLKAPVYKTATKWQHLKKMSCSLATSSSHFHSQPCQSPSKKRKMGAVGMRCPSGMWFPSCGYFLVMFALVGWGSLYSVEKYVINWLVAARWPSRAVINAWAIFFSPLCSVTLAVEIMDYTEHLCCTTCHKCTLFSITKQAIL